MADIEEIAAYIEKDSFFYASSVVTKILNAAKQLSKFPFSGRVIPEKNDKFVREHFVYHYRLIYEIRNNAVFILAVIHGKKMLYPDFDERIKRK